MGMLWILGAASGAIAAPQALAPAISTATMVAASQPMPTQAIQLADATARERRPHSGEQGAGRDRRRAGEYTREAREPRPQDGRGQARTRRESADSRGTSRPPGQERQPARAPRAVEERRAIDNSRPIEQGHRQFDTLSPEQQRRIREARERFQQLPPEERARLRQKWHALPPEERRRWSDTQGHSD